ncbi:hypothetical protein BH09VER1_BH09VER1_32930 [soil metagenome]
MYHALKKTRHTYGPRAVLVSIFLAALITVLAILRFAYELPSTTDARLLFNGKVIATMNPDTAAAVIEGMPATVTIEGYEHEKFSGVVQVVEQENARETLLMIKLRNPPEDARPPLPCSVIVDTSVHPRR